jgi:ubiquinone/menaquinone biosynthesis C-methylase UbiE
MAKDPGFVSTFDRLADRYDTRFGVSCLAAHTLCLDAVSEYVERPESVLDIGCGTGVLLDKAHAVWPAAALVGVDPSAGMLAVARKRHPGGDFRPGDAERLPVPHRAFDVVLSTTSFGHWRDKAAGLRAVARALRPGGVAGIVEHLPPKPLIGLLYRLAGRLPDYRGPDDVAELARAAGLTVETCVAGAHGYLVGVFRSPAT